MGESLWIQETVVNDTAGHIVYEGEPHRTGAKTVGELFRMLQRTYGRCVSKVYIDLLNGDAQPIGWVFQRRQKYADCAETYLQETWVNLIEPARVRPLPS